MMGAMLIGVCGLARKLHRPMEAQELELVLRWGKGMQAEGMHPFCFRYAQGG